MYYVHGSKSKALSPKFISAYLERKGVRVTHIITKSQKSLAQILNSDET